MCFDLHWFMNLLIWLVVIGAVVMIVKLILPRVLPPLGDAGVLIMQILNIVIWAAVLIAIIVFAFELISCLLGGTGLPRLR